MKEPQYPSLVIVLPCFNCGKAVEDVVARTLPFTQRILAINDGSTDETPDILEALPVEVLGWDTNRGKGHALLAGFRAWLDQPDWEHCITIDSDGQHNPADIPALIHHAQQSNADIVVGRRAFSGSEVPSHRRIANTFSSSFIASLTGCPAHDIQCGYRVLSRNAINTLLPHLHEDAYAMETEMLMMALRHGLSIHETGIECIYSTESSIRSAWRPLTDSLQIGRVVVRHLLTR